MLSHPVLSILWVSPGVSPGKQWVALISVTEQALVLGLRVSGDQGPHLSLDGDLRRRLTDIRSKLL